MSPLPLCRWQAAPIALTPTYSGFGTEPRVRQLDLPRSKLHAHPAQPLRRPAAFGGDRSASPASRRPPSPQRTTGAQMEAVNERRGHRLVAEHGAIPRLVRGGRRGRPQRASSSWKVRRRPRLTGRWPISTTSCAGWALERFDQPGQGAAVDAAAVPGGGDGAEPEESEPAPAGDARSGWRTRVHVGASAAWYS